MIGVDVVKDRIAHLQVGEPRGAGGLSLVPLFGAAPARDYLLAAEAVEHRLLQIEELGAGIVPEIVAVNRARLPVLLLDGEHLEGAKQSRIVNVSILLEANSTTRLPVSCVEQGRWAYAGGMRFRSSEHHAYARLRRIQAESALMKRRAGVTPRADQGSVWGDVARKHAEAAVVGSRSGAMRDAYDAQRALLAQGERLLQSPQQGQIGVVSCIGGRPVAVDALDQPATLAKLWRRLVRGYLMDAVGAPQTEVDEVDVKAFLADAASASATAHPAVGLGDDVVLESPTVLGNGLVWSDRVLHLSLFRREPLEHAPGHARRGDAAPIRPRRRYFHSS